jgi:hypothetical protein
LVAEGWRVLDGIYEQSQDFAVSRMYPGIPEYFSPRGRGMYPYLTGSASWYLLTMLTEVYGVRGELGDLVLAPKLLASQFGADGKTSCLQTLFAGKKLCVTYQNAQGLEYGQYKIGALRVNGQEIACLRLCRMVLKSRARRWNPCRSRSRFWSDWLQDKQPFCTTKETTEHDGVQKTSCPFVPVMVKKLFIGSRTYERKFARNARIPRRGLQTIN